MQVMTQGDHVIVHQDEKWLKNASVNDAAADNTGEPIEEWKEPKMEGGVFSPSLKFSLCHIGCLNDNYEY